MATYGINTEPINITMKLYIYDFTKKIKSYTKIYSTGDAGRKHRLYFLPLPLSEILSTIQTRNEY